MKHDRIGPITKSMFEREKDEPPALIREWQKKLRRPGDFIFLWSGVIKRPWDDLGWGCLSTHFGPEGSRGFGIADVPAASVERLLSPLAHESRARIMQVLVDGPMSASELSKATGFQGGALYHHLKELQYADYVVKEADGFRLTNLGLQLLVSVFSMAIEVIEDRQEKGLAVGAKWSDGKG